MTSLQLGNLIVSIRHQDWVVKIDYRNGEGDGHIVWKLRKDGDFKVNFTDPNLWFSHQHNAHYIDDSTLILFDNGNTRRASDPTADSRGQVWTLDEQTMTATLVLNADLGNYSDALGGAQRLSNGNFSYTSGRQGTPPNFFGQAIEMRPDGSKAYVLQVNKALYRSFRVRTLYEGTNDLQGGGSAAPSTSPHQPLHASPSVSFESFRGGCFSDWVATNYNAVNLLVLSNAPPVLLARSPIGPMGDVAPDRSLPRTSGRGNPMAALDSLFADFTSGLSNEMISGNHSFQ